MLDPEDLIHPRSAELVPAPKVVSYMARQLYKPLDKEVRNRPKGERSSLEGKVALKPETDAKMATFLAKFVKDPKKGIYRSRQDKLLNVVGLVVNTLEMAKALGPQGL
ncbi:hypothetical protein NDU88_001610 [Pleurodeles waltl]|uniref:Uncharacterized protein n=1 Tax=Pleurodeles waltl TaxID=8319 RepID=A0AAV7P7B8_PLEWA|nr:hypothetical protein NDU88_001610 [Pleurodeles waltl]